MYLLFVICKGQFYLSIMQVTHHLDSDDVPVPKKSKLSKVTFLLLDCTVTNVYHF